MHQPCNNFMDPKRASPHLWELVPDPAVTFAHIFFIVQKHKGLWGHIGLNGHSC